VGASRGEHVNPDSRVARVLRRAVWLGFFVVVALYVVIHVAVCAAPWISK
jgi:hypothetical protein